MSLVSLDLLALAVFGGAFLLGVEAQVLEENNLTVVGLVDDGLDFGTDAVRGELDTLAEQLFELRDDGLQAIFGVDLAVGSSQVRHEHDGLCAVVYGILDGGDGAGNTLVVGDVLVGVKRYVEVDLGDRDKLAHVNLGNTIALERIDGGGTSSPSSPQHRTYPDENPFTLQIDVCDGELARERHGCCLIKIETWMGRNLIQERYKGVLRRGCAMF